MLAQVLEYIDCLSIIGDEAWLLDDSILATLSSTDLTLLQMVVSRQVANDLTLAQLLY